MADLEATARAIVAPGKGILAADESAPTIEKRFKAIDVPSTEENRRSYRELLFTTPGMEEFISGVILFDETLRQSSGEGVPFPKLLDSLGILPGIKVDKGAKALAGAEGEKLTEGLDGLRERLAEYRELGARFTKWRAVITIGAAIPTSLGDLWVSGQKLASFSGLHSGNSVLATSAHLTFVALDENKKPVPVPPIAPQTEAEKKRYQNAKIRVKARKELLKKIS